MGPSRSLDQSRGRRPWPISGGSRGGPRTRTESVSDHPSAVEPVAAEHDWPRRHRHPAHRGAASPITSARSQTARMRCMPGGDFRLYRARGVAWIIHARCRTFKVSRGECSDAWAQGGGNDSWDPVHHRDVEPAPDRRGHLHIVRRSAVNATTSSAKTVEQTRSNRGADRGRPDPHPVLNDTQADDHRPRTRVTPARPTGPGRVICRRLTRSAARVRLVHPPRRMMPVPLSGSAASGPARNAAISARTRSC